MNYLYILYSPNLNKFYVGSTSNLDWRITQHNKGLSPYTKGKGPWSLVHVEEFSDKAQASKREKEIKSWKSHKRIIREFNIDIDYYQQSGPGDNQSPG
ncbi:MAG: GIY-YIG nuclease family protein [Acidobacteriota bacterium]|nr:GIY-YIG nuclease family protein [Acidobacteriota bacterium]